MADGSAVLKLLLFLTFSVHPSSAGTHTLQYLYTALTPGINFPEFTAVGLVDGEQFVSYNHNNSKMIPKTEWLKINDPVYWKSEIKHVQDQQVWLQDNVARVMEIFNQNKGVHTLQRMYGCELYDNGTTRGYDRIGYDGEDLISLDLKTGTWTADNDKARNFIQQWKSAVTQAKYWKDFLEKDCIDRLNKLVSSGDETLERKVPSAALVFQKHSSSPEVVCLATGFFPKAVNITWQKDGEDVHEDVELNETLPNQDGSFQKRSILKVPAEELQKHTYTCVIQHSSLEKELVLPVSERRILRGGGSHGGSDGALIGVIIGVVVLVVALVAVVAGIVIWKKKKRNSGL